MVFSSIIFIYFFLPIVLLIYYISPKKIKNVILLASGLFFYAWGEPVYVFLMLFTTLVDYTAGRLIDRFDSSKKIRTAALIGSLVINLGILFTFKYSGFFAGIFGLEIKQLPLPIGISFYTFQSMSYTIDMYMRKIKVQRNFINYAAYVTLFPQIVAGPIVRYEDVQNEINERKLNTSLFGEGAEIFIRGLGKKVLLANNIGLLWTEIKMMNYSEISVLTAWLGILAFTFQIYYDFSGYSDMAVGLGKMLGFNFPENFRHPYISRSISEFWRRWHITLGSLFRSYVYIPLGGNRKGMPRTLFNLAVVWGLTGLWHGASWNFILWGLYFGVLIIIEKLFLGKYLEKIPAVLSILYTFVLVVFGWVLFDTNTLTDAFGYFAAMFGGGKVFADSLSLFQLKNYAVLFVLCALFSGELPVKIMAKIRRKASAANVVDVAAPIIQIAIMLICTAYLVDASYNPFLYFRF